MVDPGVVLQKLIVHTDDLRPSYFGPPEAPMPTHGATPSARSASTGGAADPHGRAAMLPGSDAGARPVPRGDRNSQLAHAQLLEKARRGGIDLYFLGDSITRRWGTSDAQYKHFLANWRANFFGWNAANFGWGGDSAHNVLWRVRNGQLDGVHPKVIVLLAGTNNIGTRTPKDAAEAEARAASVVAALKAVVDTCREKAPEATIILMGILPRNDNIAVMPIVNRVNEQLPALADGKRVRHLNINDKLADGDGRLLPGMTTDGLHLDVKGYQVWADALKPVLLELLGPPKCDDHAPPPTGDPSISDR